MNCVIYDTYLENETYICVYYTYIPLLVCVFSLGYYLVSTPTNHLLKLLYFWLIPSVFFLMKTYG